jgi:hypothetical protein
LSPTYLETTNSFLAGTIFVTTQYIRKIGVSMKIVMMILVIISVAASAQEEVLVEESTNSSSAILPIGTGILSAAGYTGSYVQSRRARATDVRVENTSADISILQRQLQIARNDEANLINLSPELIARKANLKPSILTPLHDPKGYGLLGYGEDLSTYTQEYITDKDLSARAKTILDKMNSQLDDAFSAGGNKAYQQALSKLGDSDLQREYNAIVEEARSRGLIQSRPLPDFHSNAFGNSRKGSAKYQGSAYNAEDAYEILEREDFRHRGFINENGNIVRNTDKFVLGVRKSITAEAVAKIRDYKLKQTRGDIGGIEDSLRLKTAEKLSFEGKAKGHKVKARRFLRGGIVSTAATLGLGWFLTESTSTSSQLLENTNPAVEEISSEEAAAQQ